MNFHHSNQIPDPQKTTFWLKTPSLCPKFPFSNFSSFGWGEWSPRPNSNIRSKFWSRTFQRNKKCDSATRTGLRTPVLSAPKAGKCGHFCWKVVKKWNYRYGGHLVQMRSASRACQSQAVQRRASPPCTPILRFTFFISIIRIVTTGV